MSAFRVSLNAKLLLSLGYGGLSLSIEGPSKVDINTEDLEDGTCKVTYCPTEPGNYIINIKFADQHVPGEGNCFCWQVKEIQMTWLSTSASGFLETARIWKVESRHQRLVLQMAFLSTTLPNYQSQ